MDQHALFQLYTLLVVGVLAQSVLAWELGAKGISRIIEETNTRGRPSGRVLLPFGLFAVGGLWQRIGGFESPYRSWTDAWPIVIAVVVFFAARARRSAATE